MPSIPAPTLRTERLILSPHGLDDHAACAAMWADPDVVRFIGGRPSSAEESWARLLRYAGLWSLLGMGYWAVREAASGRFVGEVGFADFKRDLSPPLDGVAEAGWALAPWAHGRGFALEAVTAALDWFERRGPGGRTVCLIDPENQPSLRLAGRLGYRPIGPAKYRDSPTLLLERP